MAMPAQKEQISYRTDPMIVDTERVIAVLLSDGWHRVRKGSFEVGPVELRRTWSSQRKSIYYGPHVHGGEDPDPTILYAVWNENLDTDEDSLNFFCPFSEIRCMKVDFFNTHDNDGNWVGDQPAKD